MSTTPSTFKVTKEKSRRSTNSFSNDWRMSTGSHTNTQGTRSMRAGRGMALAGIIVVYLLLATGSLLTLRPWCDEGWFSSPALNLITKGYMGTSVLDPTASWRSVQLGGIHDYTYWIMPLYPLAQAAWYKLTGFGLYSMRALSVL